MKIEFLLAHEDGTWWTEIFHVPMEFIDAFINVSDEELNHWWSDLYGKKSSYRKIVFACVFSRDPEEGL